MSLSSFIKSTFCIFASKIKMDYPQL